MEVAVLWRQQPPRLRVEDVFGDVLAEPELQLSEVVRPGVAESHLQLAARRLQLDRGRHGEMGMWLATPLQFLQTSEIRIL